MEGFECEGREPPTIPARMVRIVLTHAKLHCFAHPEMGDGPCSQPSRAAVAQRPDSSHFATDSSRCSPQENIRVSPYDDAARLSKTGIIPRLIQLD